MKELCDVGHDGLLVRTVNVHILRVQELSDPELSVSHHECSLETGSVTDVSHGLDINNSCKYHISSLSLIISKDYRVAQRREEM